jgi:hypothetical protein
MITSMDPFMIMQFFTILHLGMANNSDNIVFNFVSTNDDFPFFYSQKTFSFLKEQTKLRCIQFSHKLDYVG